jgi:hypothetical protein
VLGEEALARDVGVAKAWRSVGHPGVMPHLRRR